LSPREPAPERFEAAAAWCLELAEGPLSDERQQAFDAWLAGSSDNLAAFERSSHLWRQVGEAAASPELIDVRERALATFRRSNQWRWARRGVTGRAVAAAVVVLLVLVGAAWWQSTPDIYRTGIGERRVVMLGDGSRASLDAATEVDVRMRGDRRELRLVSGRAKFDVARDPLKPFSVRVGDKLVVATGTSFSVEMINGKLRVILYEGRVVVLDRLAGAGAAAEVPPALKGGGEGAALMPGHELVVGMSGQSQAQLTRADPVRSLSWEGGQLVFEDEPLSLAVGRINRYSPRRIELKGAAGRMRVNGVFNTGDVDAFATGVEETLPVRVIRERDAITIFPQ
jgi:transmembrane sensor